MIKYKKPIIQLIEDVWSVDQEKLKSIGVNIDTQEIKTEADMYRIGASIEQQNTNVYCDYYYEELAIINIYERRQM